MFSKGARPALEPLIDQVSTELLPRAALVLRLLTRELHGELSRSEAGVLGTVTDCPQRITDLAELEGLAQPTMTLLVKRLESRGLVSRERQPHDGRVVVVSITRAGSEALERFRALASATFRDYLSALSETQIEVLAATTDAFDDLIAVLQPAQAARR